MTAMVKPVFKVPAAPAPIPAEVAGVAEPAAGVVAPAAAVVAAAPVSDDELESDPHAASIASAKPTAAYRVSLMCICFSWLWDGLMGLMAVVQGSARTGGASAPTPCVPPGDGTVACLGGGTAGELAVRRSAIRFAIAGITTEMRRSEPVTMVSSLA